MDTQFCYSDLSPDTKGIMHVRRELQGKKCTDSTLLSNLEFAESFLKDHPLNCCARLFVKGSCLFVEIGQSTSLLFTVRSDTSRNIHINLFIQIYNGIKKESIMDCHFFGHSCQDHVSSCSWQAKNAVPENGLGRLMIKCNRFSITYHSDLPQHITVETKCQFKLESITVEGLLEKKIWLQKEKDTCHGLIACLDHLIKLYLTTSDAPKNNCKFIIHADKEIIRILSLCDSNYKEYVLLGDHKDVSMFPPKWQ